MRIAESILRQTIRECLLVEAKNETVAAIQQSLNSKVGTNLSDDGKWGDKTDAAWKSFIEKFYTPVSGQPTKQQIKQSWKTYGPRLGYEANPAGVLNFINAISSTSPRSGSAPTSQPAAVAGTPSAVKTSTQDQPAAKADVQLPDVPQIEHKPDAEAHADLEKKPFGSTDNLMQKGDAHYEEFIKKFPDTKDGLEKVFSSFETARQNRLSYLKNEFDKRYRELKQKLGIAEGADPEKIKQKMIEQVESCKLWLGRYNDDVEKFGQESLGSSDVVAILAEKDPNSGWSKNMAEVGVSKNAYSGAYAYAPYSANVVVSKPPPLAYSRKYGIVGAIALQNELVKVYEHEIIHQEDSALRSSEDKDIHRLDRADVLAHRLLESAALPAESLTGTNILARVNSSPVMKGLILRATRWMIEDKSFVDQKHGKDAAIVMEIATFANYLHLDGVDYYNVYYDFITSLYPNEEKARSSPLFSLLDNHEKIRKHMYDITGESHIRITLSLMRPHLEKVLREKGSSNTATVIEDTLNSMKKDSETADVYRAAHILAITDPTKLQDLTLVAAKDEESGERTAIAEGRIFERWHILAGLR